MEAVAGDVAALQSLGQLVGEEVVAQFAVAVGQEELQVATAQSQISMSPQKAQIHIPSLKGSGGHVHHPARSTRLQPVQQQHRQQEVTQVIDAEYHPETILRFPRVQQAWRRKHQKHTKHKTSILRVEEIPGSCFSHR